MKKKIIIGSVIIAYIILIVTIKVYEYNRIPIIALKDDLTVFMSEDVTNLSFVKDLKNGIIVTKEEKIDTSTIGKKKIVLTIKNKYGENMDYIYFIEVKNNKL